MIKKTASLKNYWAVFLIFLLYPVYYLYNTGLAFSLYPQFLGGWFGPISVFFGLPLLIYSCLRWAREGDVRVNLLDILLYIFVAYVLMWSGLSRLWGAHEYARSVAMFMYIVEGLFFWLVIYTCFKYHLYGSKSVSKMMFWLWTVMFIVALVNMRKGMFYAMTLNSANMTSDIATCQGFARSAMIVSSLILVNLKGSRAILFSVLSMILMFVLGARTQFVGMGVVVFLFLAFGERGLLLKISSGIVLAAMMILVLVHYANIAEQSRITQLLDISQASSWQKRDIFSAFAWQTIENNPILGDYGSQQVMGGVGSYAHNALSAWVNFGLLGFLQFIGLNIFCFIYMLSVACRNRFRCSGLELFALAMSVNSILFMILAKNAMASFYAIAWGSAAACYMSRHVASRSARQQVIDIYRHSPA